MEPAHDEGTDTSTRTDARPTHRRGRTVLRRASVAFALVLVTGLGVGVSLYHRQIVSYVSHRKGGPSATWPYTPHEPPAEFHLAVAGDVGEPGSRIEETGAAITRIAEAEPFDALLLLGDNVYPDGNPAKLPRTVFGPFADVLRDGVDSPCHHREPRREGELGRRPDASARHAGALLGPRVRRRTGRGPRLERSRSRSTRASSRTLSPPLRRVGRSSPYTIRRTRPATRVRAPTSEPSCRPCSRGMACNSSCPATITTTSAAFRSPASPTWCQVLPRTPAEPATTDFTATSFSWHHFLDIAITGDHLVLRAVGQDGRVFDEAILDA